MCVGVGGWVGDREWREVWDWVKPSRTSETERVTGQARTRDTQDADTVRLHHASAQQTYIIMRKGGSERERRRERDRTRERGDGASVLL